LRSEPFDQDPDGSGSIQRSRSVRLIRIHHIHGCWASYPWAFNFLAVSWFFLLFTPLILLTEPSACQISLQKFQKISYAFLMCFWLFSNIFTCSGLVEIIRVNFILMRTFRTFLREFTCLIFGPKFVMWCWCLAFNFIMSLPLILC